MVAAEAAPFAKVGGLGDFSSAGGVHINTFEQMPGNEIKLGAGANGFGRLLAMGDAGIGNMRLSGALEGQVYDGPWRDIEEDVQKINGLVKLSGGAILVTNSLFRYR